jgi:diaminohydroxyphosphoribosylaminopyrimidine deaminase/5-amino-6-(5-phosphoribosylamino)uracil reductase
MNHLNLELVLKELAIRQCNELHLEAGAKLSGAFMQENLIDECLIYVAPIFLGKGLPVFNSQNSIKTLLDASKWSFHEVDKLDGDLRIVLRPMGFDLTGFLNQGSN